MRIHRDSGLPRCGGLLAVVAGAALTAARPAAGQATGEAIALDRLTDHIGFSLPERSRERAPDTIAVGGPWRLIATVDGVRTWEAPLPVRPRTLSFGRPPKGMAVVRREPDATTWTGARDVKHVGGYVRAGRADSWEFTQRALRVRRATDAGPPRPGEYGVEYPRAVERERDLNRADAALIGDRAFAVRSMQVDDTTRHGLLLPAPAGAFIDLVVPAGAVFDLTPMLLPPEAADPAQPSDGAQLTIRVRQGDQVTTLHQQRVALRDAMPLQLDLDPWAGERISLELLTNPLESPDLDYVFVADPIVRVPVQDAPRVVVVFIDTLRADHLSVYGYERQTSPNIDATAKQGAVFTQARSVAPWTLPSARTMMTGHQPEAWGQVDTVQGRFADAGWATAFLAGNIYLSSNFENATDWGTHRCVNWPSAEVQVDRALDWLDQNDDRPSLLLLHFMDAHLPYIEPMRYRGRFAGDRPDAFDSDIFHRGHILRAYPKLGDAGVDYLIGRYDNNIAYIDDQLERVLSELRPTDTLLLLADHGEEFWDHGAFEHGHTLYDEVLRVPMILRSPGVAAATIDAPVSLLDVAPTLARAAGLRTDDMAGWPLQDAADGSRTDAFAARPQAFGRPLYGLRRWGVLTGTEKFTTTEGEDALYDLATDPGERDDQMKAAWVNPPTDQWTALSTALQRPVCTGFRLVPSRSRGDADLEVEMTVPGGIAWAYAGDDPAMTSAASVTVAGEQVRAVWPGGYRGNREVFVVPAQPPALVAEQATVRLRSGAKEMDLTIAPGRPPDGTGRPIGQAKVGGRSLVVGYATVPAPPPEGGGIDGFDSEAAEELAALGYVDIDAGQPGDEGSASGGTLAADVVIPEWCRR